MPPGREEQEMHEFAHTVFLIKDALQNIPVEYQQSNGSDMVRQNSHHRAKTLT